MATYGPETFATLSGKSITIRHCIADDVDAFLEFQPLVAAQTTHTLQYVGQQLDREKIEGMWENSARDEFGLRLGVFAENKLIAQLMFSAEGSPPHPWTRHVSRFGMMVLQEYWGEGIGRRLLEIMETHARAQGFTRIEAQVRTQNSRGIQLYTRMGYQIEGTRRQAALINGAYQDEHHIGKLLNTEILLPPKLETDRLILRPLELSDASAIFEYACNPNVSRFTLWEPHHSLKDSESYILDYAFRYYREGTPEPWGIVLKSNPEKVIGTVGLFWVSKSAKTMELAYALSESFWGQGFTVEASRAACDWASKNLDVVRIQARCKVENIASAKVMQKLGMKHEGVLHSSIFHRGRHWDLEYYAMLTS